MTTILGVELGGVFVIFAHPPPPFIKIMVMILKNIKSIWNEGRDSEMSWVNYYKFLLATLKKKIPQKTPTD